MYVLGTVPTATTGAVDKKVQTSCTAGTATAAVASGVGAGSHWVINIVGTAAFDITFNSDGSSDPADPTDTKAFPAGMYRFRLCKQNSKYKVNMTANGTLTAWLDRA